MKILYLLLSGGLALLPLLGSAAPLTATKATDMEGALVDLSLAVTNHGYQLVKVQKIDTALVKLGYDDPGVRVAFVGRADQVARALKDEPALLNLQPMRIVLSRDRDTIRLSTDDFDAWLQAVPDSRPVIESWRQDLAAILADFLEQ